MLSASFRRRFLEFFKQRAHTIVPSSPVLPFNDPSLLFVNAGMNQFKDFFLGKETPPYTKACSSQKCVRVGGKHNDLENVGHTARHLTFFEMLGNFSFGDYFKEEAIKMAWEASVSVFEFDPEKIWISVFHTDKESFEIWESLVPSHRIVRLGEKDNFWSMADKGPCGPCSELFYDRGEAYGSATSLDQDVDGHRFLEFWNLVFMQNNRLSPTELVSLPKKNVDTGAGLERLLSLKLGVNSVFETDIFQHIIHTIENIVHRTYDLTDKKIAPAFRVIADHVRTLFFSIADGIRPSNTDRGYILRKLVRRAVRYGRLLGFEEPFLHQILPSVTATMGEDFPELAPAESLVAQLLTEEEESFLRTLRRGKNLLQSVLTNSSGSAVISGDDAFKLKDTYGFPIEEILLIAKDNSLNVDIARFDQLEEEARQRSRAVNTQNVSQKSLVWEQFDENSLQSTFVGYEHHSFETEILALVNDSGLCSEIRENEEGFIVLKETPFYAEKGGQIGDRGTISTAQGVFAVFSTDSPKKNIIRHRGKVTHGVVRIGENVTALIDEEYRHQVSCNHTATHLLHQMLQEVIGPEAKQAGSFLDFTRIRFDFTFSRALTTEEIFLIQHKVNLRIRNNVPVTTEEMDLSVALADNDIKSLFGEKYGAIVRVVAMPGSKELCGGTHVKSTGSIGYFRIIKESAVSAGVRRIEALTGYEAEKDVDSMKEKLHHIGHILHSPENLIEEKLLNLVEAHKTLSRQKDLLLEQVITAKANQLLDLINTENKISSLVHILSAQDVNILKKYSDTILKSVSSLVIVLAAQDEQKTSIICQVSPDLVKNGVSAVLLLKEIAAPLNLRVGGKADFAQGGGPSTSPISSIPTLVSQWISTYTI